MCCGPCSIIPIKAMLGHGHGASRPDVWGFFHNPNIHPFSEFKKRLDAAKRLAALLGVNVIFDEVYRPTAFIKGVKEAAKFSGKKGLPEKDGRCGYCYSSRLEETAKTALANGFDGFSSSLLYSRYQNHDGIKAIGLTLSRKYGIPFFYADYRGGWQAGIDASKEMGLYRQKYCGCIYSKIERYSKRLLKPAGCSKSPRHKASRSEE
ncbi:MAG: epoxyqueuosine reductase QueH [Deltaproteobacteria bacterium]|nr:epoxyqueuosine reductase QueH [Deltaproteobacteria bacterium]